MKVERTTYKVDGCNEPCINVTSDDGYVLVRIAKLYHIIGEDTILLTEYLGGAYDNDEEFEVDFDSITDEDAIRLAKGFSVYLH